MKKELMNLFLFIGICLVVYLLFRNFNYKSKTIEGMTDASGNDVASPGGNGIAGNAASYGATIKDATIKLQDTFLITKYRSDYETAILNLDDLISLDQKRIELSQKIDERKAKQNAVSLKIPSASAEEKENFILELIIK